MSKKKEMVECPECGDEVVKYDAIGKPFIVDTDKAQSWHIGQRVTHKARPVTLIINSFAMDAEFGYSPRQVSAEHNKKLSQVYLLTLLMKIINTKVLLH